MKYAYICNALGYFVGRMENCEIIRRLDFHIWISNFRHHKYEERNYKLKTFLLRYCIYPVLNTFKSKQNIKYLILDIRCSNVERPICCYHYPVSWQNISIRCIVTQGQCVCDIWSNTAINCHSQFNAAIMYELSRFTILKRPLNKHAMNEHRVRCVYM